MFRKVSLLAAIASLAAGGGYFQHNYRIEGLDKLKVVARDEMVGGAQPVSPLTRGAMGELAPRVDQNAIRVAAFNIQVFGASKLEKTHVMDLLARIARQYDVLAIQEIRSRNQDVLPRFVDHINEAGRHYDYVIGPRLGRSDSKEQYAYVFDRETIEVDRTQIYTVQDPDDLLHRPPLVAMFRVRGPDPQSAFTFTLVNVHTDPDEVADELNVLDDVFRLVQNDGRGEDDVIMLGDFNADDRHFGQLGQMKGATLAVKGVPTNTRGTKQYDNLVFCGQATTEFSGRGGIFDFMREFNLSLDQALEVSDHLPVWAEFTVHEGGRLGQVARLPH